MSDGSSGAVLAIAVLTVTFLVGMAVMWCIDHVAFAVH